MFEGKRCAFCKGRAGGSSSDLGTLLGPVASDSSREDDVFVHRLCALWSPEVYQTDHGTLRCVWAAVKRSRGIRCFKCGKGGASTGCRVDKCQQSFHLACAKEAGCAFYPAAYMLACPAHMHLFSREPRVPAAEGVQEGPTPGGVHAVQNALPTPLRTPDQPKTSCPAATLPGKKSATLPGKVSAFQSPQKLGQKRRRTDPDRHVAVARSALKRLRAELRAAEDHSSDDETHFARKEARRLLRDRGRLAPVVLGGRTAPGAPQTSGTRPECKGTTPGVAKPGVVQPVGNALEWGGFETVGGLRDVVRQLREMVLLPLQYPQLFQDLGVTPPRGILLHGEPGTGKTLVARALAGACAAHSPVPVTFFARKAADCLGKFSGEAERTLRLLFHEAQQRAPSIIFMDELDGLVPARSGRSGGGDQIYASVVSTLLALMDGVTDRGAVVVLAATNRPDAIDPALRRPGRFDRDVYFGLPSATDRADILRVHTAKWPHPPSEQSLQMLAQATEGYAGADLRALCGGAVSAAVHRCAPSLFDNLDESALPHYSLSPAHTPFPTNGHSPAGQAGMPHASHPQPIPLAEFRRGSGNVPSADSAPRERLSADGGAMGPAGSSEPAAQGICMGVQGDLHDTLARDHGGTVGSLPLVELGVGAPAATGVECDKRHSDVHTGVAEMAEMEADQPGNVHAGALREEFQPPEVEHEAENVRIAGAMETLPPELDRCVGTQMAVGLENVSDRTPGGAEMAGRDGPGQLDVLSSVKVLHCDWRCALAAAPAPCAQRQGLAMAAGAMQRPMPWHLAPVLLPSLAVALRRLGTGSLPLPDTAEACIAKAGMALEMGGSLVDLENVLQGLGVAAMQTWPGPVQSAVGSKGDSALAQSHESHPHSSTSPTPALGLRNGGGRQTWPICRLLVTGEGDAGQSVVSSALLRALVGAPLHCLSLAALVVAGEGDPVHGCIHIVQEALRKASPNQTVVFFMPSVEAWALVHARIAQQDLPGTQAEGEPLSGHSGRACSTPAKADGSSPSPFRGLVSLEQRGQANPTIGWAQHAALPKSPGSLPQNLRSNRRAPGFVNGPFVPTGPDMDHMASSSSLGFAGRPKPGRLPRVSEEKDSSGRDAEENSGEDDEMGTVELIAVSRTWQAFEQVIRQVPATQPLLVLATSQHAAGGLPEPLLDFFGDSGKGPNSRIIQLDPTTVPASAWTEALLRCVDVAAQALATEGAAEIVRHRKACLQGSAAAEENVSPGRGPSTSARQGKEAATQPKPIRALTLNVAEREQGLKLLNEVRAAGRVFCTALYRDRRAHAACAMMTTPEHINHQSDPADPVRLPLAAVAKRGSRGTFGDPGEFMDEMRRSLTAGLRPLAGDRQPAHTIRAAAAAALLDEIDAWRYALETRLGLNDPALRLLYSAAVQEAVTAVSTGAALPPNNADPQLVTDLTPACLPAVGMVVSTGPSVPAAVHRSPPGVPVQNLMTQDAFQTPANCSGQGLSGAGVCESAGRTRQEGPSKVSRDSAQERGLKAMASGDQHGAGRAQLACSASGDISQEAGEVIAVDAGTTSLDVRERAADDRQPLCGMVGASQEGHAVEPRDVGGARVGPGPGMCPMKLLHKTGGDTAMAEQSGMRMGSGVAGSVDGNVSGGADGSRLDAAGQSGELKIAEGREDPKAVDGTSGLGNNLVSKPRSCPQSRDIKRALYARLKAALMSAMAEGWQRAPSSQSLQHLDQLLGLACGRAATWAREATAHIAGPPAARELSEWPDDGLLDALADALGARACQALQSWQPTVP